MFISEIGLYLELNYATTVRKQNKNYLLLGVNFHDPHVNKTYIKIKRQCRLGLNTCPDYAVYLTESEIFI